MNREQKIEEILIELGGLEGKLEKQLKAILELQLGWRGTLTKADLLEWEEADLKVLYDVTSGMRLTREYVPDIVKQYASAQVLQSYPSQVSFGQMEAERKPVPKPDAHFGKYEIPPTLLKLFGLERELGAEWMDRRLGLMPVHDNMRYESTPPDFIPFAQPGMDGIHYCFVTDFGTVTDLEEAYIAVVSPMDFGSHIWLAARNLRDFLALWCSDRAPLFNRFKDELAYLAYVEAEGAAREQAGFEQLEAEERLRNSLGLTPLGDIAGYMRRLREERSRHICIRTLDSIGVAPLSESAGKPDSLLIEWPDEVLLADMLRQATPETKLAVVRDLQFTNRIYDRVEYRLVTQIFDELELYHEHINLQEGKA